MKKARPKTHPIIQALREERQRRGLSLVKLGEMSGYNDVHLWSIEAGKISAKIQIVSDIAQVLGMKITLEREV